MKRIILFVIVFWMIFAVVPTSMGTANGKQYSARVGGKGLTAREPIYINGNSDFTSANGVVSGSGTEGDPYIIEEWDINASTSTGIDIKNMDVYFIIRNCIIHDGKSNYNDSIYFSDVQNSKINNVTSYNNYFGIVLDHSSNSQISNCTVYNNSDDGILVYYSSNNQITNCDVYNNSDDGIQLDSSSNNEIHYCSICNNSDYGIYSNCIVNATSNWWGSTDGPYHPDTNPNGTGDNVTDKVLYDSWFTDPVETGGSASSENDENNLPVLSNGTVSPLYGDLDTIFIFNVTYTDEDNDTPVYVNVIIDGFVHNITQKKQNDSDNNYTDGCIYEYSTNLSEGFHTYYFNASDGVNTTTYPPNPPIYGIRVTEKEEEKTTVHLPIIPFLTLIIVIIAVEIAVGVIFLIMRKRTMILKCPKCSTIFKVERKKEAFKVECPTCGAEGTIKPVSEKKTSPEKPTRTLRCPRCEQAFTVEEKTKPFAVKCPHCGNEGTIR